MRLVELRAWHLSALGEFQNVEVTDEDLIGVTLVDDDGFPQAGGGVYFAPTGDHLGFATYGPWIGKFPVLGYKCTKFVLDCARRSGAPCVRTIADKDIPQAARFLIRLGFHPTDNITEHGQEFVIWLQSEPSSGSLDRLCPLSDRFSKARLKPLSLSGTRIGCVSRPIENAEPGTCAPNLSVGRASVLPDGKERS